MADKKRPSLGFRGFSSRKSIVEQEDISRIIKVRVNDEVENLEGKTNVITTTKYSLLSWLPVSLGNQFKRFANKFFAFISILMMIGTYAPQVFASPLEPWSTVLTLFFVLMVTSVKEGMEDYERAKHDSTENNKEVIRVKFENGRPMEEKILSKNIQAGDIIKLVGHCQVPVDFLIILTSNYADGNTCYIETASIDGETNLKVREAPQGIDTVDGEVSVHMFNGSIEAEPPNKNIHNFAGALDLKSKANGIPLNAENVIWRASVFSNTDWAYGIAIYCGEETKVQMNNIEAISKESRVEEYANSAIMLITATMV